MQRLRDHKLDENRLAIERAYAQKLAELDDEIAHERRLQKDHANDLNMKLVVEQRIKDLAMARASSTAMLAPKEPDPALKIGTESIVPNTIRVEGETSVVAPSVPSYGEGQKQEPLETSQAKAEWEYQKKFLNADSEHVDALMNMIGLESVKQQVLAAKTKVDTFIRQGASLKDERFGVALLGNPGTGM